jgi:RimJ/RimL family protein N-acetyltransferase
MPGPVFIETDRLELRTAEEEDLAFLQEGENHPEVRRHIGMFRTPTTGEDRADRYEEYDTAEDAVTVLPVPKAGGHAGDPVGSFQLAPVNLARGWANFAGWLHPDAWGHGFATETGAHLVDHGFREMRLHRISAVVSDPNEASLALCDRLDFTHEGTRRDAAFADGSFVDLEQFGLLEDEWDGPAAVPGQNGPE